MADLSRRQIEERAAVFRALDGMRPLTVEEALDFGLLGWNIRCNRCGSYGAQWLPGQRPGWGALALCPPHRDELHAEVRRHEGALRALRAVAFEQEPERVVAERRAAHRQAHRA